MKKLLRSVAVTAIASLTLFSAGAALLGAAPAALAADATAPSIPTNISATQLSPTSAIVTWTASTDVDNNSSDLIYYVYRNGGAIGNTPAGVTNFTDTGVSVGPTYSYTVRAADPAGNISDQSTPFSFTISANNNSTTTNSTSTAPSVPMNLMATAVSPNQVNLSWTASTVASTSTTTLAGYTIFRNGSQIANTASTTYSDMNLSPATTYNYFVSAFDNLGNASAQSSTVSATTFNSNGTPVTASSSTSTLPSIPTGLTASSTSPTSITLAWTASTNSNGSSTPITYTIYRNGTQIFTTAAGATSFVDTGLTPGTTYSYTISATDVNGTMSAQTTSVSASTQSSGGTGTTTPPAIGPLMGWLIIPLSTYNRLTNATSTTGTTTPPSSPYNFVNGYPMMGNNYVDCNGNVDNDPAHHTLDPNDHDPAHHQGTNCPGGMPSFNIGSNNNNFGNANTPWWLNGSNGGMFNPFVFLTPGSGIQWVVVPLTTQLIQQLNSMNWSMSM